MKLLDLSLRPLVGAACVAFSIFAASSSTLHAQAGGMFGSLAGNWSGSGTILVGDGGTERIRCRATYTVDAGGSAMQQNLRCASDSYKFELSSDVRGSGGNLTGNWSEASRGVNGTLEGRGSNGSFEVLVSANAFVATLYLKVSGNKQTISITSKNTDLRGVNISLTRS